MIFFLCVAFLVSSCAAQMRPGEGACDPATRPRIINETGTPIVSPDYPLAYPHDSLCEWLFTQPSIPAGNSISLSFTDWGILPSTDCVDDGLDAYDGMNDQAPLIGRFCGLADPGGIGGTGNSLFLRFRSNADGNVQPGFRGIFGITDVACGPGQPSMLTNPQGTFTSPNHPANYEDGLSCSWHIMAPAGQMVSLQITNMGLEIGCCGCDFIRVHDGPSAASPVLGTFCANVQPPALMSSGNSLFVLFVTDFSIVGPGFTANYMHSAPGK
jgi:cubilin